MRILVDGKEQELTAIGENGVEWTEDLLGNYGALHYDEDHEIYTMSSNEFEWWQMVAEKLNNIYELENYLTPEDEVEYQGELFAADLEDEVNQRLEWLQKHVRQFKIYGDIGANPDTVNFRKYMKEIEERINTDSKIIERAKRCNAEFAKCLRKFLVDPKNNIYIGSMVAGAQVGCKRYSYIKHLNFNGKEYEAEIDELERRFRLIEV